MPEYYIGLMSGTSVDGIDAALVDFSDENSPRLLSFVYNPFPQQIKDQIKEISTAKKSISLNVYGKLDVQLGYLFSECVLKLLKEADIPKNEIKAIGSHGQTVYHAPNAQFPFSLQIGDPNIIAEKTGITTIADFRRRDIAAGGQGAPLVPTFHQAFFGNTDKNQVIVNIGGVANITILTALDHQKTIGFDTGPGNTLMDQWIQKNLNVAYDKNGDWAKSGKVVTKLVSHFKQDSYFETPPPKSTGKEYFSLQWLDQKLESIELELPPEDVQASLCQLTADSISEAIKTYAPETDVILICGGGIHNRFLFQLIQTNFDCPVISTTDQGIHPDHVEAMAFAWLAKQTMEGKAGNLTEVTGAKTPVILGGIYPVKPLSS